MTLACQKCGLRFKSDQDPSGFQFGFEWCPSCGAYDIVVVNDPDALPSLSKKPKVKEFPGGNPFYKASPY